MLLRRLGPDRERGQIVVLFALVLVVVLLFTGIVVDLGMLRNDRQQLVNTMDAAALAGGTKMPVDGNITPKGNAAGGQWDVVQKLIIQTVNRNYPGLSLGTDYTISYRCLVGVNSSGQAYLSRDVPTVCNPAGALGHSPVAADFTGAGNTRSAPCDPTKSFGGTYDKCNVVVVRGTATTPYGFGPVVGIMSGSTGSVLSAACKGPCGQPPSTPVDLVVLIDRTASMSSADVTATKDAAKAILGVYDPALQRVALGLLGPSETSTTCGSPAVSVNTYGGGSATAPTIAGSTTANVQSAANVTGGATTLVISKPTSTAAGDLLVAGLTFQGGTGITSITAPAGWTLILRTNNSTNLGMATYYKVATSSEPASYTWTFLPTTTVRRASGGILRYAGVDTANPINVSGGATGNASSSPYRPTAPSVTTTTNQTALIGFYGILDNATYTPPSGSTERFDVTNPNAVGPATEGATVTVATASATGTRYATSTTSGQWVAQHIALNPVPVDTYGVNPATDLAKWIPIGMTGIGATGPTQYNEAYQVGGVPNAASHIVSAINCFDHPGGTGTNLATPMAMATYYLQHYGRPGVKWGIILETDGQPSYSSTGDPTNYTCAQADIEATAAKAAKIEVFTVGFGLDGSNNATCPDSSGSWKSKKVTTLLASMATQPSGDDLCVPAENTDGDHFFCEPKSSDLTSVFSTVATTFANISVHLVQLYPTPVVTSVAPATGPKTGGTVVTINGQYFTGATSVKFGATPAAGFTVVSDTKITATAPAGAANATVSVVVTTSGGVSLPSPTSTADDYKYGP